MREWAYFITNSYSIKGTLIHTVLKIIFSEK